MKKKILVCIFVFLTLCFSFGAIIDCSAETEPTIEVTEEPIQDNNVIEGEEEVIEPTEIPTEPNDEVVDEITFNEQVQDFLNTWFTPLVSSIAGILGSSVGILILKSIIKALSIKIEEQAKKSNENNEEADKKLKETEEKLRKAEEKLQKSQQELQNYISEFKVLVNNQKEILSQDEKFKELIAIMFATTPELMNNGMASKVLELLNEKEVDANE